MDQQNDRLSETVWKDIVRVAVKVSVNDSERVKSIKAAILKIDEALESGNKDHFMCANAEACSEFPEIVFVRGSGIVPIRRDLMESQPLCTHSEALRAIGNVLYRAMLAEKTIQTLREGSKVGIERVLQKRGYNVLGLPSFK